MNRKIYEELVNNLENICDEKELRCVTTDEDDPYGLAQISTSKLKAELRRRKRW